MFPWFSPWKSPWKITGARDPSDPSDKARGGARGQKGPSDHQGSNVVVHPWASGVNGGTFPWKIRRSPQKKMDWSLEWSGLSNSWDGISNGFHLKWEVEWRYTPIHWWFRMENHPTNGLRTGATPMIQETSTSCEDSGKPTGWVIHNPRKDLKTWEKHFISSKPGNKKMKYMIFLLKFLRKIHENPNFLLEMASKISMGNKKMCLHRRPSASAPFASPKPSPTPRSRPRNALPCSNVLRSGWRNDKICGIATTGWRKNRTQL